MRRIALLFVLPFIVLGCDPQPSTTETQAKAKDTTASEPEPESEPEPDPEPEPKPDPELHDAFANLCNATERSGAASIEDPSERIMKVAGWIKAEVKHPEALKLFSSLATMDPSRRADAMKDAAKKAGVDPCPMADEN